MSTREETERWADDHFTQGEVAVVMRMVDEFGWRKPEHTPVDKVVGSDLAEFTVFGDKLYLYCLVCMHDVQPDVHYLNQAVVVWNQHVEDMRASSG